MKLQINTSNVVVALVAAGLVLLPLYSQLTGNIFILTLFTRIIIFALAAASLNLIMGYGGMMSFGHAAYLGIGGYAVGILAFEGIGSGFIQWPVALVASALYALVIGALSLRTRGVYFIMITLAFAQMMYYLVNSMKAYGGDEGLSLPQRASDLGNEIAFYYVVLALLLLTLYGLYRVMNSRFGRVIVAIRENPARVEAIGLPVYRYQLACFVIAGAVGGLAGALLASHGKYVNPNVLHWVQSGTLMIMVILGGVGHLWGGVIGATVLLVLEHVIADYPIAWLAQLAPNYQQHANLGVGLVLLVIVLFAPQGIAGLLSRRRNA